MKKFKQLVFLACGLLLTLAAFPVFAQETRTINRKPFNNLAQIIKQEVEAGKIDLTESFSVELEGFLAMDGRFDPKKSKFVKSEGDEKLVAIIKSYVQAVSDSGWFAYLKDFGIEKVNFALVQNDKQTYVNIVSEIETSDKAKTIVSGLDFLTRWIQINRNEIRDLTEDEKILVGGLKASSEDKTLTLKFAYDKFVVQEMIKRKLEAVR